jgi:hypothetical protein
LHLDCVAPKIRFRDTTRGVFWDVGIETTTNTFRFTNNTGGANGIYAFENGSVGIGTLTPSQKLHVIGSTRVDNGGLFLGGTSSISGNDPQIRRTNSSNDVSISTGGSDRVTILGTGNVGIGTTSPGTKLHIFGPNITTSSDTVAQSVLRLTRDITDPSFPDRKDSAVDFMLSRQQAVGNNLPYTRFDIRLSGTTDSSTPTLDVMSLLYNGNVGIGTTAPDEALEVRGANKGLALTRDASTGSSRIYYRTSGTYLWSLGIRANSDNYSIFDEVLGSERFTILKSNGNVGIGTTSPAYKLDVDGNIRGTGFSQLNHLNCISTLSFGAFATGVQGTIFEGFSTNSVVRTDSARLDFFMGKTTTGVGTMMSLTDTGNVGIGTTSPQARLDVRNSLLVSHTPATVDFESSTSTFDISGNIVYLGTSATSTWRQRLSNFDPFSGNSILTISESTNGGSFTDYVEISAGGGLTVRNGGISTLTGSLSSSQGLNVGGSNIISNTRLGRFADGTAATPAYSFSADTNNGMYRITTDTLGFSTAGTEKMRISSAGNVGIGTTNPGSTLDVNGMGQFTVNANGVSTPLKLINNSTTGTVVAKLAFQNNGVVKSSINAAVFNNDFLTFNVGSDTERMRISAAGNVSIGNTNNTFKLDVSGTGRFTDNLNVTTESRYFQAAGPFAWGNSTTIGARMGTDGVAGLIDFRRWLGSGTLHHVAAVRQVIGGSSRLGLGFLADDISTNSVASTVRMYIDPQNGYVGVGTDSPDYPLHVVNNIASNDVSLFIGNQRAYGVGDVSGGALYLGKEESGGNQVMGAVIGRPESQDDSTIGTLIFQTRTSGSPTEKMRITSSGNVGIGTTSPTYKLDVTGTIRATGDVIAFSDERVKENIYTIENALDKVNKLRGVEYNKIGEEKQSIGVIAQEIEKILPQVVHEDEEGMKSVAYGNIVGVLIEAIKEQQRQIHELKMKIDGITN